MQISIDLKEVVLRRDHNHCARCGGSKKLDAYVIRDPGYTYDRSKRERVLNPLCVSDCTTLCRSCAKKTDRERDAKAAADAARKARPRKLPEPLFGAEMFERVCACGCKRLLEPTRKGKYLEGHRPKR